MHSELPHIVMIMQKTMCAAFVVLALMVGIPAPVSAIRQHREERTLANPIRKVVNMLQTMQKKVTEEGEREKKLYSDFMCYCKNGGDGLEASIAAAETKVPAVQKAIEEAEAKGVQTKIDLKAAQVDRSAAKEAMAAATAIREKEAAAFATEKADYTANIDAITKAVTALEKGAAGGFLQTRAAEILRQVVAKRQVDTEV